MQLDRGVMRLYYEVKDWVAIATFRTEGDRLFLANDVICTEVGEYRWSRQGFNLVLEVIDDPCSFELRGRNLSRGVWELCPENRNAEDAPEGCKDRATFQAFQIDDPALQVHVHQGDARTFDVPPTIVAVANDENIASPEGVSIRYHANSVEYGVNRVLWWRGDWIEAEIEEPVNAMGVQFYGTESIGWASVLFDGKVVWRGDVSTIWNHFGSYGGYIEVTGFEPGKHVLRVELVEGDYRPLTIAVFGFSKNEGVQP